MNKILPTGNTAHASTMHGGDSGDLSESKEPESKKRERAAKEAAIAAQHKGGQATEGSDQAASKALCRGACSQRPMLIGATIVALMAAAFAAIFFLVARSDADSDAETATNGTIVGLVNATNATAFDTSARADALASGNLTFAGGALLSLCPDATLDAVRDATKAHMSPFSFLLIHEEVSVVSRN